MISMHAKKIINNILGNKKDKISKELLMRDEDWDGDGVLNQNDKAPFDKRFQ